MLKKFFVYQRALKFYKATRGLKFGNIALQDQFERASLSIVLNLSEGSGKPTRKDKAKYYAIAFGSLREVQTLLDILDHSPLANEADQLGALIFRLIQSPGGRS